MAFGRNNNENLIFLESEQTWEWGVMFYHLRPFEEIVWKEITKVVQCSWVASFSISFIFRWTTWFCKTPDLPPKRPSKHPRELYKHVPPPTTTSTPTHPSLKDRNYIDITREQQLILLKGQARKVAVFLHTDPLGKMLNHRGTWGTPMMLNKSIQNKSMFLQVADVGWGP